MVYFVWMMCHHKKASNMTDFTVKRPQKCHISETKISQQLFSFEKYWWYRYARISECSLMCREPGCCTAQLYANCSRRLLYRCRNAWATIERYITDNIYFLLQLIMIWNLTVTSQLLCEWVQDTTVSVLIWLCVINHYPMLLRSNTYSIYINWQHFEVFLW